MAVDNDARALAIQANTAAGISAAGGALKRISRLRGLSSTGPVRPAAMASPISVTTSTSAPSAPYTTQWPSNQTATDNWLPVAQFWGGWLTRATNRVKPRCATSDPSTATSATSATGFDDTISGMSFMTDEPSLTIMVNTSNTLPFRFKVNGEYISTGGTVAAATGDSYITIDLSSYTPPMRIDVEGPNSWAVQRILTNATSSVWATNDKDPHIMVLGDSYTVGPLVTQYSVPTPINQDGWVRCMANALGINDVWASGIGGTGWKAPNGTKPALVDRAYDSLNLMPGGTTYRSSWRPDMILVAMGINDVSAGKTTSEVTDSIDIWYRYVRARDPLIPILITGVQWRPIGNLTNTRAMDAAIAAKIAELAVADPFISYSPVSTSSYSWCTGTGYEGATNGSGNSDFDRGIDGVHPSYAGHAKLGERMASEVVKFVTSLAG